MLKKHTRESKKRERERENALDKLKKKVKREIAKLRHEKDIQIKKVEARMEKLQKDDEREIAKLRHEKDIQIKKVEARMEKLRKDDERKMEDIEALVSSFETVDSGHQLHMQPVIMQASTPVEAQINFENSTKVIFKNIHHQSIRKVLSSGMVATDELSAMSGVPRIE